MGTKLDLKEIALRCRNTEYNPTRFSACIMRLREPKTTMLLFSSGKCVITGARSAHNAHLAARKFGYILTKVGYNCSYLDFKIQNVVGTTDVLFPIRLEGICASPHQKYTSYEPELFPGLIYRMIQPKVVLLIFVSGKVVITGARTDVDLSNAMTKIYPVLNSFKKDRAAVSRRWVDVPIRRLEVKAAKKKKGEGEALLAIEAGGDAGGRVARAIRGKTVGGGKGGMAKAKKGKKAAQSDDDDDDDEVVDYKVMISNDGGEEREL